MDDDRHEWVSVSEAVGRLRRSERTVRRWATGGRLPVRDRGGPLEVNIAGELGPDDRQDRSQGQAAPDTDRRLADLQAEVRHLQALVEALTGERDYLRRALAASLGTQHLLAERATSRRKWWRFWRRDPDGQGSARAYENGSS